MIRLPALSGHLGDAEPGAGGLHLHLDVPAVRHFRHREFLQRGSANGAEGAHVGEADAVERAHAEPGHAAGQDLVPVHRTFLALAEGAGGENEVLLAREHGAGDLVDEVAAIRAVTVEEDDDGGGGDGCLGAERAGTAVAAAGIDDAGAGGAGGVLQTMRSAR
eukprot:gene1953-1985_t